MPGLTGHLNPGLPEGRDFCISSCMSGNYVARNERADFLVNSGWQRIFAADTCRPFPVDHSGPSALWVLKKGLMKVSPFLRLFIFRLVAAVLV